MCRKLEIPVEDSVYSEPLKWAVNLITSLQPLKHHHLKENNCVFSGGVESKANAPRHHGLFMVNPDM